MSVQLNILCLISINRQYPQNYIEFDKGGHVEFCLDVLEITLLHYYIISNDSGTELLLCASLSNLMQVRGIDDLCKLGKEYLTALTCQS